MTENPIDWRVIRAAPDLLEALEALLRWKVATTVFDPAGYEAIGKQAEEQARAAIAKATDSTKGKEVTHAATDRFARSD
jgi:hypothetical protein